MSHQTKEAPEVVSEEKPPLASVNGKGTWREWKTGLATIGGGAALALTGGLAAPFLAADLSTIVDTLGPVVAVVGGCPGNHRGSFSVHTDYPLLFSTQAFSYHPSILCLFIPMQHPMA